MRTISIQESKQDIIPTEINALTVAVGWGQRDESKWERILEESTWIVYAKDAGKLIAFGRILEDGVMCMFYDICVHPDYQGKGMGSRLIEHLINKVKDKRYVSIGLFVWEENESASDFYKKFGFEKVSTGMELTKYMEREG